MRDKIRSGDLQRRWIHSHEEDSEREMVFRPASYPFPPSRGRTGFELRADGSLVHIGIAPADGPRESAGHWTLEDECLILEPAGRAEPSRTLRIVSASQDRLVVRK